MTAKKRPKSGIFVGSMIPLRMGVGRRLWGRYQGRNWRGPSRHMRFLGEAVISDDGCFPFLFPSAFSDYRGSSIEVAVAFIKETDQRQCKDSEIV